MKPPFTHTFVRSANGTITRVIVLFCLGFCLAFISTPRARAQAPAAPSDPKVDEAPKKEEINVLEQFLVTEAPVQRFANGNADFPRGINDAQPYYIFSKTDLETSGATDVEEFLKQRLSMDTTALSNSQSFSNGIGLTNSINLRGLGAGQTLVLINGRRIQGVDQLNSNVYGNQVDVNAIPQSAIDRIEVLPSSASGIYGAAAAGGVINVIMKKNYNGGEIKATYGNTFVNDAPARTLSAAVGVVKGNTSIMLAASFSDVKSLLLQDRPQLAIRGINTILKNNPVLLMPSGIPYSGATPNIQLSPAAANGYTNPQNTTLTLRDGTSLNSLITYVPAGTSPSTPAATLNQALLANAGSFNYGISPDDGRLGLLMPLNAVPTRKSFMATITQQVTPNVEIIEEFMTNSNNGFSIYNHVGASYANPAEYVVPGNAPDNPFQENVLVKFPFVAKTPLTTYSRTASLTTAIDVKLPHDWYAEADYTWSENNHRGDAEFEDNTQLAPLFANGTLNPFVDTHLYPLDMLPHWRYSTYNDTGTLNDVALRASGPLYHLPWGNPTLSVGLERRQQGDHDLASYLTVPLAPLNNNFTNYFGQKTVTNSIYGEIWVPIVTKENSRFLLSAFDIQLAIRHEESKAGTGTPYVSFNPGQAPVFAAPTSATGGQIHNVANYSSTNPTIGFRYSPTPDFMIRGSYSTAFIPPTNTQLVSNANRPSLIIIDPNNGQTYSTFIITGGSPNLQPQTTVDWDGGIVWAPAKGMLKGLRVDLEAFYIKETNVIGTLTGQVVLNTPTLQNLVTRDPVTGLVTLIDTSARNLNYFYTDGWDLSVSYRKDTPAGTFRLSGMGTFVDHYKNQILPGTPTLEYAGYPSFGGPVKTKGSTTLSWERHGLVLGWTARYVGPYGQYGAPASPLYTSPSVALNTLYTKAQGSLTVPSQNYHDVFASYDFSNQKTGYLSGVSLQVGVTDVFNTVPPLDVYYSPDYYSPFGDYRLRTYSLSIRKTF